MILKKDKKYVNTQSAMANMLSEMTARDIINEFNKELTSDPNRNYDILHNHIKILLDTKSSTNIGINRTSGLHVRSYILLNLEMK